MPLCNLPHTKLNGYPIIASRAHSNCVTVMMDAKDEFGVTRKVIVATWFPACGTGWTWGHYIHLDFHGTESEMRQAANDKFDQVAKRNEER